MSNRDEWGRDPAVQGMRRVFARMEMIQRDLLVRLKCPPFDDRLRRSREEARNLFERVWPHATRRGITRNEEEAAVLYAHCLAKTLTQSGIKVSPDALPPHEGIGKFLDEKLK